jgi:hypothetical protein
MGGFEIKKPEIGSVNKRYAEGCGPNGQWKLQQAVEYFREANTVVSPAKFGRCLRELFDIGVNGESEVNRIKALTVIINLFMPKNWQEIQADIASEKGKIIEYTPEFLKVLSDQANQAIHKQAAEAEKDRDATQ